MRKTIYILLGVCGLLVFGLLMVAVMSFRRGGAPNIRVGTGTTYLTTPLDSEGYVNYIAALDAQARDGVTPENNAVVVLWEAWGPSTINLASRETYFRKLGVPVPPELGQRYIVTIAEVARQHPELVIQRPSGEPIPLDSTAMTGAGNAASADPSDLAGIASEHLTAALRRPWSADEFPDVAKWLETNHQGIELLIKGSQRPRYYSPIFVDKPSDPAIMILLPASQQVRGCGQLLMSRAMQRLEQGDFAGCQDDIIATFRWGHLVRQSPFLIDGLVGIATETIAHEGTQALVAHHDLSPQEARRLVAALELPDDSPSIADRLRSERLMVLDTTVSIARYGHWEDLGAMQGLGSTQSPGPLMEVGTRLVDWNIVLEQINSVYDQMTEASQVSDPWQRRAALDEFQKQFDRFIGGTRESITSFGILWKALRQKPRSELVGTVITALMVPAIDAAQKAEDRSSIQRELTRLALWLSVYHGQKGEYPESLEALVPEYIDQVPLDTFSPLRRPVIYRRLPDGYLLYSVGQNGVDDGGLDDSVEGDIVVRVIRPQAGQSTPETSE